MTTVQQALQASVEGRFRAQWMESVELEALADAGADGQAVEAAGDLQLDREQVLLEHMATVRFIARRIHERLPAHVEMDDLVAAGMLGLIDAFTKFDHGKKVQFKSYAQFRIRGAILDSLRLLDWSPRELRRKGRAAEEAMRAATARLGRVPTGPEVARELGVSLDAYQQLMGDLKGLEVGSLQVERGEDSGDEEIQYLPTPLEEDPLFLFLESEKRTRLLGAIDGLPEKERMVLTLYYYEELSMKEIGLTLGVVESRVSQIHAAAVARLQVALGVKKATAKTRKRVKTMLVH
jgi:RNA polymerase sigma factor for flagellar operon FliA